MNTLKVSVCAAMMACAAFAQDPAKGADADGAAAPGAKGEDVPQKMSAEDRAKARRSRMDRMRRGDSGRRARVRSFGKLSNGAEARLYRIQGAGGLIIEVSDYGGRLVRCYAPDKYGNLADVTLGWNTAAEYEKYGFSAGTLIGRYGNRIADGKFTLDGHEYQLPVNENKAARHCNLHGGPDGWDKKIWKAKLLHGPVPGIELTYVSKDGEMGFPGTVACKVTYRVLPGNTWTIDYEATTDKPTVLNLTHHSYWNLAGESSGNVLNQELKIFADEYTQTTAGLIPTKNAPVKGTGFDFTELRPIGAKADLMKADASLAPMDNWYDHNFFLRGKAGALKPAAKMRDPVSGRTLEVWTTEPGMQIYDGYYLPVRNAGVALETQHFPDSPNKPAFPTTIVRPGQVLYSTTEYRFKTC